MHATLRTPHFFLFHMLQHGLVPAYVVAPVSAAPLNFSVTPMLLITGKWITTKRLPPRRRERHRQRLELNRICHASQPHRQRREAHRILLRFQLRRRTHNARCFGARCCPRHRATIIPALCFATISFATRCIGIM